MSFPNSGMTTTYILEALAVGLVAGKSLRRNDTLMTDRNVRNMTHITSQIAALASKIDAIPEILHDLQFVFEGKKQIEKEDPKLQDVITKLQDKFNDLVHAYQEADHTATTQHIKIIQDSPDMVSYLASTVGARHLSELQKILTQMGEKIAFLIREAQGQLVKASDEWRAAYNRLSDEQIRDIQGLKRPGDIISRMTVGKKPISNERTAITHKTSHEERPLRDSKSPSAGG